MEQKDKQWWLDYWKACNEYEVPYRRREKSLFLEEEYLNGHNSMTPNNKDVMLIKWKRSGGKDYSANTSGLF